jgi:hypothetical protein
MARSKFIIPELMIGLLLTVKVFDTEDMPTLVTVPLPPPLPPVLDIVTSPLALLIVIPVPATMLVTPVFVIETTPVEELVVIPTPVLPRKVVYGLAHANSITKLSSILLNAVYSESLPYDSLGNPILISCPPGIAIIKSSSSIYQKILNGEPGITG